MVTVDCQGCGAKLSDRAAVISTCPMGDELIHSYFFCAACQQWTVELYHDRFMGEDSVSCRGPYAREVGERDVARIRHCETPTDKMCDCQVHRTWY